jgi:hypothetical protein
MAPRGAEVHATGHPKPHQRHGFRAYEFSSRYLSCNSAWQGCATCHQPKVRQAIILIHTQKGHFHRLDTSLCTEILRAKHYCPTYSIDSNRYLIIAYWLYIHVLAGSGGGWGLLVAVCDTRPELGSSVTNRSPPGCGLSNHTSPGCGLRY